MGLEPFGVIQGNDLASNNQRFGEFFLHGTDLLVSISNLE